MKNSENNPTKCLMINNLSKFVMDSEPAQETEKAFQFSVMNTSCGSNKLYWIPKSLLKREEKTFILPDWFVNKTFGYIS